MSIQLAHCGLTQMVHVVFDNIEIGRYYYVRNPGEHSYDLYGRVRDKTVDRVILEVLFRRPIVDNNEGVWDSDNEDEGDDEFHSTRNDTSVRYYIPE